MRLGDFRSKLNQIPRVRALSQYFSVLCLVQLADQQPPRIQAAATGRRLFQVRYQNPLAGDVRLIWGLNNFSFVPPKLPPKTFLTYNGSHMNTTMNRDGDAFVFEFEVPENTRLDYAFTITRTADDKPVDIWAGADSSSGYYTTILKADAADEKVVRNGPSVGDAGQESASKAAKEAGQPVQHDTSQQNDFIQVFTRVVLPSNEMIQAIDQKIHVQVRFRNPNADEVVLVWGLNNFSYVLPQPPLGTFLTYNGSHMNTPMTRTNNVFVVDFDARPGTRFDYAFTITRTSDGEPAQSWIGGNDGGYFTRVLSIADANEVESDGTNQTGGISAKLLIGVGISTLIALWILYDWRRGRKAPT